jgi:hypothetical protein
MNESALIELALSELEIPFEQDWYHGTESEYIYYTIKSNAQDFADDIDITEDESIQVHYFTPNDPTEKSKSIRKAMRKAGLIYIGTQSFYEIETNLYHRVIEFRLDADSETQEDNY